MNLVSKKHATTRHIFKHLCDQMDKLNMKMVSVEEVKAQANLAKQANNILNYELNKSIAVCKFENIVINDIEEKDISEETE